MSVTVPNPCRCRLCSDSLATPKVSAPKLSDSVICVDCGELNCPAAQARARLAERVCEQNRDARAATSEDAARKAAVELRRERRAEAVEARLRWMDNNEGRARRPVENRPTPTLQRDNQVTRLSVRHGDSLSVQVPHVGLVANVSVEFENGTVVVQISSHAADTTEGGDK